MMREFLRRRDSIFWAAAGIFVAALILAAVVDNGFLLLMVGAYLLRPTLHSLGFAKKLVDERQMQLQYRASNVGFAAMVIGNIAVALVLMGRNDHTWEMLTSVLMVGIAVRALARLVMEGDFAAAGPRILIAMGLVSGVFGLLEGGLSADMLGHAIPGVAVIGMGLAARKWPRSIAATLVVLVAVMSAAFIVRAWRGGDPDPAGQLFVYLIIAAPAIIAAFCLWRAAPRSVTPTPAGAPVLAVIAISSAALASFTPSRAAGQSPPLACSPWGNKALHGTMCILAHDDTVFGRRMPAGTRLHYDSTGVLNFVWFLNTTKLDGLELKGTGEGPHHTFYPNGTPRMLWLARTQDVQGVPCRPISFWTEIIRRTSAVYFHPSGRLRSCRLGRATTIQGVAFSKGERIDLDAAGKVVVAKR